MWQKIIFSVVVWGLCLAAPRADAAPAASSGIAGKLTLAPSCPGPTRPERSCETAFAGARILVKNSTGKLLQSTISDAEGGFQLQLAPGNYSLQVENSGMYPRCETLTVKVDKAHISQVEIACDSGMR